MKSALEQMEKEKAEMEKMEMEKKEMQKKAAKERKAMEKKAKKEANRLEKARLEQEKKRQLRRDELTREMTMMASRRGEVDSKWRELILQVKEPTFKKEVETIWHVFERTYDKKDHLINHLMNLINIAENQYQLTICGVSDIINTNILNFFDNLTQMSKEHDERTASLLEWGDGLRDDLVTTSTSAENHLQILIFHADKKHEDYTWEQRGENIVKEEDELSSCKNIRENLVSFLENVYNNMWDEYKAVLTRYVQNTAENQKQVRRLRHKENKMINIIYTQGKKLASSDLMLERLKKELALYETGTKQAEFRARRDSYRVATNKLKTRFYKGMKTDQSRLETLLEASDDTVHFLEEAQKKGLKILRLSNLCRKFETEHEKVSPYGALTNDELLSITRLRRQKSEDSLFYNTMVTCAELGRLWGKITRAELSKRALLREKEILERENNYLLEQLERQGDNNNNILHVKVESYDEFRCICGDMPPGLARPSVVDGAIEVAKYKRYYEDF